jgi:CMP-N,N'-diacetyllegionaminic acid synthase
VIAVIPARKGSKRLPNKNITDFCGKPLIAWVIEAALSARTIESVYVATDCEVIAEVARGIGAQVPFLRSTEDAGDFVPIGKTVVRYVRNLSKEINKDISEAVILQATSPLTSSLDIDCCVERFTELNANAVVSVVEQRAPIEAVFELEGTWLTNAIVKRYAEEVFVSQQQNYGKRLRINGAIVVADIKKLEHDPNYFYTCERLGHLEIPADRAVDIDDRLDLEFGKLLFSLN